MNPRSREVKLKLNGSRCECATVLLKPPGSAFAVVARTYRGMSDCSEEHAMFLMPCSYESVYCGVLDVEFLAAPLLGQNLKRSSGGRSPGSSTLRNARPSYDA